ncbi:hypothetical protein HY949_02175 [Candidatus Gottesmanbacteria bacterium]|nr:hypothetical protein [Candidatus Gottesmanbacteria bacterium]
MDTLKKKVQETKLFTDKEKIDILADFDAITAGDRMKLEEIIDEYDAKYKAATGTFASHINEELDRIEKDAGPQDADRIRASTAKIRTGLTDVLSN